MSLLGLDIGTSGCKVLAVSKDGTLIWENAVSHKTLHPQSGYAELNSALIWDNVKKLLSEVGQKTKNDPVEALSVSSLGEAVVPVTKSRTILANSILGADCRGESYSDYLKTGIDSSSFYEINPNIISPCYSYPKIAWIRDNLPDLYAETDYFLHWADFICFMLGAEPSAGNSLANRTLLFDIRQNNWSDKLFTLTGMDKSKFGKITEGGKSVGNISSVIAEQLGLPDKIALIEGGHDQCLNALGAGAILPGTAVCGIGTFECITPVFTLPKNFSSMKKQGLNIEHHVLPDLYVAFIYNQAGSIINWFLDVFAKDGKTILEITKELPDDPSGLFTLPYFEPSGTPGFISDMCGAVIGLKFSSTRGDILKSIMESTTYYFHEVLSGMEKTGVSFKEFAATGGGSRSIPWLQIHADILGLPFKQSEISESSVLGAALLAGLGIGVWKDPSEAVKAFVKIKRTIEPDMKKHKIYKEHSDRYRELFKAVYSVWK